MADDEARHAHPAVGTTTEAGRVADAAFDALLHCDAAGSIIAANRAARRLAGGVDLVDRHVADAYALDIGPRDRAALREGRLLRRSVRGRGPQGERTLEVGARPFGRDGEVIVTIRDVTEQRSDGERLERLVQRQRRVAEFGRIALRGGTLRELAHAAEILLDRELDAAGVRVELHPGGGHGADPAPGGVLRRPIRDDLETIGEVVVEATPGGLAEEDLALVDHVAQLLCHAASTLGLRSRLLHQSQHDALTGLPNREMAQERLRREIDRAQRDGTMVGVLVVDIDRFKQFNETLGQGPGNALLVKVARRLREQVHGGVTVARLGGDEFVVVLPGLLHADEAVEAARGVATVLDHPFSVSGRTVRVRVTVGVSLFPRDGDEASALMVKSDSAMQHGKRRGRNTVRVFSDTLGGADAARLEMEHDLQVALSDEQLALHYQPRVCTTTGRLVGLEALARWHHPKHGWVPPTRFVPVAEDSGLIVDLGAWAVADACRAASTWVRASDVRVSVNLSPTQLGRAGLLRTVAGALEASGLAPERLELEVTESIMLHDIDLVTRVLRDLRAMGVRVALDDFGLGYSSVGHLRTLPLDAVKIDKSFLDRAAPERGSAHDQLAILSAVTTMAQALGLRVTVEGVETRLQYELAREVGCDEVQGHLFGRAAPSSAVPRLLGTTWSPTRGEAL
jgi:diguanylate cyclase (GGDEF)-like protein